MLAASLRSSQLIDPVHAPHKVRLVPTVSLWYVNLDALNAKSARHFLLN